MSKIQIEIFEVRNPSLFYGREVNDSDDASSERILFHQLHQNINDQFNNPQSCGLSYQPSKNEVCIGRTAEKVWCRVRVEDMYRRQRGHEAKCFLLDYGTIEMIPFQWLRRASPSHHSVPYQVKSYGLYGIQALTLAVQGDLSCHMEPCVSWDESATEYFRKCLQMTALYFVEVQQEDANKIEVNLYLAIGNQEICVNDELIKKEYAVKREPGDIQRAAISPGNSTRSQPLTIEEELRNLQLKKSKVKSRNTPTSSDNETMSLLSQSVSQRAARRTDSETDSVRSGVFSDVRSVVSGRGRGLPPGHNLQIGRNKTETLRGPELFVHRSSDTSSLSSSGRVGSTQVMQISKGDSPTLSLVHDHQKPETDSEQNLHTSMGKRQGSLLSLSSGDGSVLSASLRSPMNGMLGRLMNSLVTPSPSVSQPSVSDSELLNSQPPSANYRPHHTDGSSAESVQRNIRTYTPSSLQRQQPSVDEYLSANIPPGSTQNPDSHKVPNMRSENSQVSGARSLSSVEMSSRKVTSPPSSLSSSHGKIRQGLQPAKKAQNIKDQMLDLVAGAREESSLQNRKTEMMSKMQGDRILANLSGGVKSKLTSIADMPNKLYDSVLVHSLRKVTPYLNFDNVPLVSELKEILKGFEFPSPMLIQAYGWPGILKLNHVVGISPVQTGKTFTYLCPLLSELLNPQSYQELAIGNGPLALILVSSWKKAQGVYDITRGLLREHRRPRPLIIYGGGCEHNQYIPLMNGCEILIATPPCLIRMINRRYTDLQRLCHLVVDDAEIVLKEYSEEVQKIMEWFAEARKENLHKSVPYQVVAMGTQWTPPVLSFTQAYMLDPTIVITSRFEAAIYGKVTQQVHMCPSSLRSTRLLELLDAILNKGMKVIIFTTTVNDVCFIMELLKSHSLCCNKIHHQMDSYEVEAVLHDWSSGLEKDSPKLLVCTDECIDDMKIDDANAVIHFDLPSESKTRFGNRLSCMRKYYAKYSESEEQEEGQLVKPMSYILMTEHSTGQARSVRDLLKRLKTPIPRELAAMLAGMKQQQEGDKEKELCSYLKAYGVCRFQSRCPHRHIILPDVDKPANSFLTSGEVKICVANVVNATCYYARVLEHRAQDGTLTDLSTTTLSITFELKNWFSVEKNCIRLGNVCAGDVCAIVEDDSFFRVQIQDIKWSNSPGSNIMQAQVFFVDEGRVKDVSIIKLYELPPHLKSYPFQTVEVYLCRLRPIDRDENWTSNADQYAHELLQDKVLFGRIVLSIGHTVWLDPLVERQHLKGSQTTINKMYIRSELLHNGYAVDNEQHVQNLYELCEGLLPVPNLENTQENSELSVETDLLPESEEFHKVCISACDDPGLIFVQRCVFVKQMDAMVDTINDRLQKGEFTPMKASCCKVGTICLGKYTQDDTWYRVKILECLEGGEYKVIFCDQGDTEVLALNRLNPIPQECFEIPMLAIECELAHVQPRGKKWDEKVGDAIWDMTHTVAGGNKHVMAKVVGKKDSVFTGVHRYVVELWDTYTANDINLAQELVWSGLVAPKEGSNLMEMFPKPPVIDFQLYRNPTQMIMDLCACLYWRKDQKRRTRPAREILDIVEKAVKSSPLDLVGYRGLAAIIKLIGRLSDDNAHKCLLRSLLVAAEASDRLAEEIVNQDGDHSVIQCLDQRSQPEIQCQAVDAIYKLISCNNRFVKAFSDASVLEVLCEILEVADERETLYGTGRALNIICKKSKSMCRYRKNHVRLPGQPDSLINVKTQSRSQLPVSTKKCASDIVYHFKVCHLIAASLERTTDLEACRALLEFLVTLVDKNGKQEPLHNEKLAKVVVSKMDSFFKDDVVSSQCTLI
uniref:RNA helicase n=1 Tax=Magallana gigas TaxID=29159 RepID=A0A8W8K9B9_MAGGI